MKLQIRDKKTVANLTSIENNKVVKKKCKPISGIKNLSMDQSKRLTVMAHQVTSVGLPVIPRPRETKPEYEQDSALPTIKESLRRAPVDKAIGPDKLKPQIQRRAAYQRTLFGQYKAATQAQKALIQKFVKLSKKEKYLLDIEKPDAFRPICVSTVNQRGFEVTTAKQL